MSTITRPARPGRLAAVQTDHAPAAENRAVAGIGWFSLALGTAELLMPRAMSRLVGARLNPTLVRLLGAREIASGLGILSRRRPFGWLIGRVAGDVIDLAVLQSARPHSERGARSKLTVATLAVAGVAVVDAALALQKRRGAMPNRTPREQLIHFLSDLYSMEQQALAQLIAAPDLAGDPEVADHFREHYAETQRQSDLVEERLLALGGSPSKIKDAIMRLGGKGMLLFAAAMPETLGRLVVHSYSYEAMEWAAYQMLLSFSQRAGDLETADMARRIAVQERAMMERLARDFDAAEHLAHAGGTPDRLASHLRMHLNEVHAFESQGIALFRRSRRLVVAGPLKSTCDDILEATYRHAAQAEQRLIDLGSRPSRLKDLALAAGGANWNLFFQAQSDTPCKLVAFVYAVLHLEIGGYEMLRRTAGRTADAETQHFCDQAIAEKHAFAHRLAEQFDLAVDATAKQY